MDSKEYRFDLLSGELPGVGIRVADPPLDGLLDGYDVLLQGVRRPRVEHLVQELAAMTPDVPTLRRDVRRQDGHEAGGVRVTDNESAERADHK